MTATDGGCPSGPPDEPRSPLAKARSAGEPLPFVQALRWLRKDANRSFQQIANSAKGKLPKSTAHYMTTVAAEPEQTRLPAREELVELFVRGCGRPEAEVRAWVGEWRRLKQEMKLAKEKTDRLGPVPDGPPEPPDPAEAEPALDPAPATQPAGHPEKSLWQRFLRWIGFLTRMLFVMVALTAALRTGDDGDAIGLADEVTRSVLLVTIMGSAIASAIAESLRSPHQIGNVRRIVLERATAVLGDHQPTRV